MKRLLMILCLSTFLCNCNSKGVKLYSYKQVPSFIKSYIDTACRGLTIADKGERWIAGCVMEEGQPNSQFISCTLNNKNAELVLYVGGIAPGPVTYKIDFEGQKVTNFKQKHSY